MFQNYLKVALRNLMKRKFHTAVNVFGLAIGIAACLLITLFVKDELAFDRYHNEYQQIYRIATRFKMAGQEGHFALAPAPSGRTLVNEVPEVIEAFRFRPKNEDIISYGDFHFKVEHVVFADHNFFRFFNIPLVAGDTETILALPNTLAMSRSLAEKYFGSEDPIGREVIIDNKYKYRVSGVYEDIPANTHFRFDVMYAMSSLEESRSDVWLNNNFYTYLKLRKGADPDQVMHKIKEVQAKYYAPQLKQYMGKSLEEFAAMGNYYNSYLQPLADIHLHSRTDLELAPNSDIRYVYIFSTVALFILIIACVNFMNLATAKNEHRAREVGVRKVLGALRKHLIAQFLVEAIVVSSVAMVLALLLIELALPGFNAFTGKSLGFDLLASGWILPILLLLPVVVGFVAGSYPALFLSHFQPVSIIRGALSVPRHSSKLRNGLVVFQFALAVVLIVSTIVVFQQLKHLQEKELGYNKADLLVLHDAYLLENRAARLRDELLGYPVFQSATMTSYLPAGKTGFSKSSLFPESDPSHRLSTPVQNWWVDPEFINTFGLTLVMGRNFSADLPDDTMSLILNEQAARHFGIGSSDTLGQMFGRYEGDSEIPELRNYRVIGIVRDFHFRNLRTPIEPMVILPVKGEFAANIAFRIDGTRSREAVKLLEKHWKQHSDGKPFEYSYMDDRVRGQYEAERKLGQIFAIFCFLAIFIACLGLFGLASYTTEQRTREIGIRKILGASIVDILLLLGRDFSKLILIAFFIGAPLAYILMDAWLQDFAYSISINWTTFLIALVLVAFIAIVTVSYQSIRAGLMQPVESIKHE